MHYNIIIPHISFVHFGTPPHYFDILKYTKKCVQVHDKMAQTGQNRLRILFRHFQSKCFSGTLGPSTQYSTSTELENFILLMRCAFLLSGESL